MTPSYDFKTLTFPNDARGQDLKVRTLTAYAEAGWEIVSETVTPGKLRGANACCLFLICIPLAFMAGHTTGHVTVTLRRDRSLPGSPVPVGLPKPSELLWRKEISTAWGIVGVAIFVILLMAVCA